MTYEQAAAYIEEVPKFTKKNKPEHTKELLRRLGNPEEKYRVVHVAGTNGKGSVCAFLSSILEKAGYQTGLFISPHLVKINERFQINRQEITDEEFLTAFNKVKAAIDSMMADGLPHATYFELLFAMGVTVFADRGIDILVMETGLGGRLDATNTVAHPDACVITSISLDHMEYLGNTVAEIAGEKAGIIKEGVPVIYDAHDREAAAVIEEKARQMHAPAIPFYPQMAEIVSRSNEGIDFVLNNTCFDYKNVHVPFLADYQVANSSLALMAAKVLDQDKKMRTADMLEAVARTSWEGRMEMILPGVVLDGAHNADGVEQFLQTVKYVQKTQKVNLLFAAVADKEYEQMIRRIASEGNFESIVVTSIGGYRAVPAEEFARLFRENTTSEIIVVEDVREAFRKAMNLRDPEGILFCVGSLYLVGEIKAEAAGQQVMGH